MKTLEEIYEFSSELTCSELFSGLINNHYKGRTIVSASLRARSIVVLQLIAEVDPSTPIVFCHAGPQYPESEDYRNYIIDRFGLTDVRTLQEKENIIEPGHTDHIEWIMASAEGIGEIKQALHLNQTLSDFECWISGVYHMPSDTHIRHRIDLEGHLLRVNPLLNWSNDDINRFMRAREIPYHKFAHRKPNPVSAYANNEPVVTYGH